MSTIVLPGSFDPFTLGHLDLARRAAMLCSRLIIAISHNPNKKGMLSLEARQQAIDETIRAEGLDPKVTSAVLPRGLLVDFCREHGARAVVRGMRGQIDLAYEEPMARMNQHLAHVDTVFLLTDARYSHISSSLVREVSQLGGPIDDMLPEASRRALEAALAEREEPTGSSEA
ncbi:pantetheine-phosphate adenylyltransferase [Brachybacterium sp. MASK1Z-5]|uniref:Phosphopantetheine adenylyltransferase n=1 Tax=Brachybacterium halotolerans TaxID=2795215 RepID=A0ABS1B6F0_9MICO|nr:pantetheine-phosphate adenylyltransferase [Brachybacterium halotolerans]MBK0330230.1 pantetheine-phosphate adenylyltransferase [Brachybacterium halotolerans]